MDKAELEIGGKGLNIGHLKEIVDPLNSHKKVADISLSFASTSCNTFIIYKTSQTIPLICNNHNIKFCLLLRKTKVEYGTEES